MNDIVTCSSVGKTDLHMHAFLRRRSCIRLLLYQTFSVVDFLTVPWNVQGMFS